MNKNLLQRIRKVSQELEQALHDNNDEELILELECELEELQDQLEAETESGYDEDWK